MSEVTNLTNYFLIALPTMTDPNFRKAVIYVCEHSAKGAVGIIINQPMTVKLGTLFSQLKVEPSSSHLSDYPLLSGGPLHRERGFVIHSPSSRWETTINPSKKICVTTSKDIIQAIAKGQGPTQFLVALGCAGWQPQQLEKELAKNIWLCCQASPDIVFNTPILERWIAAARLLRIDIHTMTGAIGHA